ncbi:uncharacterized protein Z518_04751 [Rhinocladiella mackenziei CBS 650.93]|uniref:LEA domain protein n=1 Tax=Rhinocladiella mackenziei CBS 650.93 TaxID=1442369 RepID=A0A0D2JCE0_9EURO|nr:uncharacterized protein Z518_04751 [Rhinocladiella mackenziei CBS 650.93]KIX06775.1 hypothetical protein Z518_04751 [Rhinocladiella mackenziei CBS 650.93]
MSFLYKTTSVLHPAVRSSTIRSSPRLFSTAIVHQKSAAETVKDGLKRVDRTVSDAAVVGIDKGMELKNKATKVAGIETGKAQGKAQQAAGEAQGKATDFKSKAKGKAEEVQGKMS